MARVDPNDEWLGHVQPVGLVVAPIVLARYGLTPELQTRVESETARAFISPAPEDDKTKTVDQRALKDPWAFFQGVLGWRASQVAGAPNGPALPEEVFLKVEESDTEIAPDWAVADPEGGCQMLVRVEAPGVDPDERGALAGWEATPHQRFERLLREKETAIGVLVADDILRLIYAPRGETSGWMTFPLRSLIEVGGRPMLGGLKLLLSSFRLHNDAPERRLPALLKASRDAQAEVSTRLAAQVLGALHELLRGLHTADRERIEAIAEHNPEHLYDGLLAVLLRLVFLLYAEDRDLIPSRTDAAARALYAQGYGVRSLYGRLLDDRAHHPDTMDERRGAWGRLLALFSLVHHGDSTRRWLRGRGGRLFDPAAYPFLQGQDKADDKPAPAPVSDGCILRILDSLITVEGEKLSYRTLDVEQIGSVYETVMGFAIETRPGPAVAIKAGKNDRTPVFVDLAALVATKGTDRAKFLKEEADRRALPDRLAKALAAAKGQEQTLEALRAMVDERGSPGGHLSPPGTPLLQPSDERRGTGSHYTPRSLTEPIVRHALEPTFERIGPDAKPEEVLALKVCDPAMGSGAFLVEACRALGGRLVRAWDRWPEMRPKIPEDEDEPLHARRLVAQRCLYGVDKNPRAVELAKLSLWLATLARDHEFTFLDHALKSGDSLVGLDAKQIAAMHWDPSKPGLPLFRKFVADRVHEATKARAEIQAAPDDTARAILESKHLAIEGTLANVRVLGDAVISAFFAEDKPKARENRRATIESWVASSPVRWDELLAAAASLRGGEPPLSPFHWPIEFPEIFARENGGFNAIVGNPPFAGVTSLATRSLVSYTDYLRTFFSETGGKCDLIAFFFRRAFDLLANGAVLGLIASKSIAQGHTRASGLGHILRHGGLILRATKRLKWPGEAAVVVSVVHVMKSSTRRQTGNLESGEVPKINSFLVEGNEFDVTPLHVNSQNAFVGAVVRGEGFILEPGEELAPGRELKRFLQENPKYTEVIKPFWGGEELNRSMDFAPRRSVIDFGERSLEEASKWSIALGRVEQSVKLQRSLSTARSANENAFKMWWRFGRRAQALHDFLSKHRFCLARAEVAWHHMVARVNTGPVFQNTVVVFTYESWNKFAVIQSRTHELWSYMFGSSMKNDPRYVPRACHHTFPFVSLLAGDTRLDDVGLAYHDYRTALMLARREGMTKTYNRFHNPSEQSAEIERLRELHARMDRAVLSAYGWDDLAGRAQPVFLDESNEDDHTYQGRLFWPSDFRDEVLARLLALNAERHAEEVRLGVAPAMKRKTGADDETEDDDD
jgi:hypothetical protein